MNPQASTLDVALLVAKAIEDVGGAYLVGGSLASSIQGEPRATNDVSIVLEIPLGAVRRFVDALGPDFEVDVDQLRHALRTGTSCNIFYLPYLTKVDLFAVGPTPYDEVEFSRALALVRCDALREDAGRYRLEKALVVSSRWGGFGTTMAGRRSGPDIQQQVVRR